MREKMLAIRLKARTRYKIQGLLTHMKLKKLSDVQSKRKTGEGVQRKSSKTEVQNPEK